MIDYPRASIVRRLTKNEELILKFARQEISNGKQYYGEEAEKIQFLMIKEWIHSLTRAMKNRNKIKEAA